MSDSDDDSDDGFYLTSSLKTSDKYCVGKSANAAIDDDDDDDDDDCDNWEERYNAMSSAADSVGNQGDHVSVAKLPSHGIKQEPQESVKQVSDLDFAISSSEDEELSGFAAAFDSQPKPSAAKQCDDMDIGEKLHHVASDSSPECSDDSDDELPAAAWQRLHGNRGGCKLKVEGIDDVSDFISEFVHQPVAPAAETTGKCSN